MGTTNQLEEKVSEALEDMGIGKDFLIRTRVAKDTLQ